MTRNRRILAAALLVALAAATPAWAILFYSILPSNGAGQTGFRPPRQIDPRAVAVPPGYCVEPVVTGLTYPTGVIFDDAGRVYVVESSYSYGEDFLAPRLVRVEPDGQVTPIAVGKNDGPWTGGTFH